MQTERAPEKRGRAALQMYIMQQQYKDNASPPQYLTQLDMSPCDGRGWNTSRRGTATKSFHRLCLCILHFHQWATGGASVLCVELETCLMFGWR